MTDEWYRVSVGASSDATKYVEFLSTLRLEKIITSRSQLLLKCKSTISDLTAQLDNEKYQ